MKTLLVVLFCLSVSVVTRAETAIAVGTLNCYLCFDPARQHVGHVADEDPLSPDEYRRKIDNLAALVRGVDFVGLEEVGGEAEVRALAVAAGKHWAFAAGRDTATGENVGAIYSLPGWSVFPGTRVRSLDRRLSKHLLIRATKGGKTVEFLVIHLLRPIHNNAAKHAAQIDAVRQFAEAEAASGGVVVVVGDTNNSLPQPLWEGADEAGAPQFRGTHLTNKPFDRLIVTGVARWSDFRIVRPPYAHRPSSAEKRLWTDHFFASALLLLPE